MYVLFSFLSIRCSSMLVNYYAVLEGREYPLLIKLCLLTFFPFNLYFVPVTIILSEAYENWVAA